MASPPRCRASPPFLPDELIEEILLRLPPDDPPCILRVSVVCKTWSSTISQPSFRRRLHDLHRTPPVLGFIHNWRNEHIPRFIPTTASSFEFSLAAPDYRSWQALDCRHGRALFLSKDEGTRELLLWEPITGAHQRVPVPATFESDSPTAAVFCAAGGCGHVDCFGGPFHVVFVFAVELDTEDAEEYVTSACTYSSETGTWGELTSLDGVFGNFFDISSVLVGNSLIYFMSNIGMILEYDLSSHSLTVIDIPDNRHDERYNLILSEGGGLGVIEARNSHLKLWSWEAYDCTNGRWVLSRVIYLENFLPNDAHVDAPYSVHVLGFAEGANVIFVLTLAGLFTIELQSNLVRKVCDNHGFCNLIPVVGFYNPHYTLKAPGGEHHDLPWPRNATKEETLKFAHELFDKGCKAVEESNFSKASERFSYALKIRVLHYGKLAPQCASTFYRYGCALLCKALVANNSSCSNVEHVPLSERGDYEEGENLNSKDQEDVNMTCDEANSDLDLAWKMLDIARVIVAKSPEKTMAKVNISSALAEVSMKREDRFTAIGYYLQALAILEHLFRPDDLQVVQLNIHICAKAISACQSLIQNLENAKEALLLADKDVSASATKGQSGKFTLEDKISSLNRILARLQKKLEELEQTMSTSCSGIDKIVKRVISQTSHEQNISKTAAATGSTGSSVNDSGIVSRGIKLANDKLISAEPSPDRLAVDDSPSVKCDYS